MTFSKQILIAVFGIFGTLGVVSADALADATQQAYKVCEAYENVTGLDERQCFETVDTNKNRFPQTRAVALCQKLVVFWWNPTDCLAGLAGKVLTDRQLKRCEKHFALGFSSLDGCL